MMIEKDLLYTKDHEWAKVEDGIVTVGITDHAQELLGELTYVELPEVDAEVSVHDEIGVVESSKSANDLYSPVAGKVVEVNNELEYLPELINDDCYGQGWICKIELADSSSLDGLMDAEQYTEYLKEL